MYTVKKKGAYDVTNSELRTTRTTRRWWSLTKAGPTTCLRVLFDRALFSAQSDDTPYFSQCVDQFKQPPTSLVAQNACFSGMSTRPNSENECTWRAVPSGMVKRYAFQRYNTEYEYTSKVHPLYFTPQRRQKMPPGACSVSPSHCAHMSP